MRILEKINSKNSNLAEELNSVNNNDAVLNNKEVEKERDPQK